MLQLIHIFNLLGHILPIFLLFAQTTQSQQLRWPYNLPASIKYYPEDEAIYRREEDAHAKLQYQQPSAVRKLSSDPGEKFYLHYWDFEGDESSGYLLKLGNKSDTCDFTPSLPLHADPRSNSLPLAIFKRTSLSRRDFECPVGTFACTSISRPNSCCNEGSTCQLIQDTGLGDVGCCPSSQICSGSISQCPAGGYSDCPGYSGGGCCLPNYSCLGVGCVLTKTDTIIVTVTSTTTSTTTNPPSTSATTTPTTTTTITPTSLTTTPPNVLVCSTGYRSCPASLGGGCCPTDRACGSDACPEMSTTNTFIPPGRPTSNSVTTSTGSNQVVTGCPTGFYACSAVYHGGCCQTGRNCDTTSCPVTASITVVDGQTITAVAPSESGITAVNTLLTGPCATGWSTCLPDVGGGCCPTGYACGTICTATASGLPRSSVYKIAPSSEGSISTMTSMRIVLGLCLFSIAMAQPW